MFGRPVWLELRTRFEQYRLAQSPYWHGNDLPDGAGRPVVVIPGFMSGARKAEPMRRVLDLSGWQVEVAGSGLNAGPAYKTLDVAVETVRDLAEATGKRVSIVGHSRGGQVGRVLAVRHPELVGRVIAVGTPLLTKYPPYFVVKLPAEVLDRLWRAGAFGPVSIGRENAIEADRYAPLPRGVELISVYSRDDGIVDWHFSQAPDAKLIEVSASHLGLMCSVVGVRAITDALNHPLLPRC